MTLAAAGLARIVVSAPSGRVDVVVPDRAPLAELLPDLLRHLGSGLADTGAAHGGWLLRRSDGNALTVSAGLADQGVRDGEVLHLVPADQAWPELAYDDVVDMIAAGARRTGRIWDGAATHATALAAAAVLLLAGATGLFLAGTGGAPPACLGAVLLLAAATVAAHAYREPFAAAVLGGCATAYAFIGGYHFIGPGPTSAHLLLGSVALLLAATIGVIGAARPLMAAVTAGTLGTVGALLGYPLSGPAAAAILLTVVVLGAGTFPLLAVRLAKLPMAAGADPSPERVILAVRHADEVLTGLLGGAAVAACGCAVPLSGAGPAARLLVAVAGVGLLVRSRIFPSVRQKLALLVAGAGPLLALAIRLLWTVRGTPGLWLVAALGTLALALAAAGSAYRQRPPGPYLGRTADILDVFCVAAMIPVGCAALGLYAEVRGLAG